MLKVNETRKAHNKARNKADTPRFPSLSLGSSRGRSGVVSSVGEAHLASCETAILKFGSEMWKPDVSEKSSYRPAMTNAL